MALQGNLRDFSATEILQLLGTQKKTGCLLLEWNTEKAVIHVQEGRIVSTRRPGLGKDDPLLLFLRRIHRLSDEQARGILTIQRESDRDLEDLLLNGRYLDAEELAPLVERQILDDIMRLVRWEDGSYRFDPAQRWAQAPLVRLNIDGALIEAARRVDEQKRFVALFKDPHELLGLRDFPDPNEPLSEEERELFGIIDGTRTLSEVVEAAPLSEYEAYEALQRMLEADWIEVVGRRDPGLATPGAPAPEPHEVRRPRRLLQEILLSAAVLGTFAALVVGAHLLAPRRATSATSDVFVAAQVRDLRFALELYHRERAVYPPRLEDLVEDRWIDARQTRLEGYHIAYHAMREGADYRLDVVPDR
jgi:hypothetical protein